ncbi:MAG TPA: MFS transporter [Rhodopila sp.]|uniref:MFS transporter n=1 Tax=Rhodopila sp. TaxID=2480087 RepID=UPI002B7978BB|nr:MFS transporter [Rhodopila sp.]HVY15084.1 MFS transporter [Rhodopila sp.]
MQGMPSPAVLAHEVTDIERETIRRVSRRLLPMLIVCYFVAYLDRVNVGFASLTMNKALGFSSAVYGFGGGIFFLGYFLFEVPSNILLSKVGARRWIARILVTWGIISACTALITGPVSFYSVRFLLGLAEAGFFPGIILYLTWWFPSYYRSRIVGVFMAAIPLSNILGSLVSGELLNLDGWMGLAGWQWLFVLEAVPAVVLGIAFWLTMTDWPSEAHWLSAEQRAWLTERLDAERAQREAIRHFGLREALFDRRVLLLSLVYFGGTFSGYGIVLFQPQIVHRLAAGFGMTGVINAIPYVFAALAMIWWGRHSDHSGERPRHVAAAYTVSAAGLIATAMMTDPVMTMVMLVVAAMGQSSTGPTFWSLPTAMLSGTAAAGGIALINALGNLGGFFGPYLFGLVRDATGGSFTYGLMILALGPIVSATVVLILGHDTRLEHIPRREMAARRWR